MDNKLHEIKNKLEILKLDVTYGYLINENINIEIINILSNVCDLEIKSKEKRAINSVVKVSNFPYLKTIEDFNFNFQPNLNENKKSSKFRIYTKTN